MSPNLNLPIGVLALLSLPALSACNTGGGGTAGVNDDLQAVGESRGTDTRGPIQQEEDIGSPRGAIGAAEDEQGLSDAGTMGAGRTGGAAQ